MSAARALTLATWALTAACAGAAAAQPPVVFAVDTSRSLTAEDLSAVRGAVDTVLGTLPEDHPAGLIAFDDDSRWLVPLPGSIDEVRAALPELVPRGDFTLLHDALFTAIRALPEGGVVVLATDGWDENSATTVEDVASLAQSHRVRLLPLLVGRRDGALPMRRLALLTDGTYLGRAEGPEAATEVTAALAELSETPEPAAAADVAEQDTIEALAPAAELPPEPRGDETRAASGSRLPGMATLALLAAAVGLAVTAVMGLRRRRSPGSDYCPTCGSDLAGGEDCAHCAETELEERLAKRPIARLEDTAELAVGDFDETEADEPEPGVLEKTRVLTEHHLLQIREAGGPPRSYLLRREEAFAIGRDSEANTLALPDPALSARHLRIVPEDGRFYVLDLGSTNGTFLGGERVRARRLRPGDVVRAGQMELEYRVVTRALG